MEDPNARILSLAEQVEIYFPQHSAAAKASVEALELINTALEEGPLESRAELAEKVGISEERVEQVMEGDGNVRVSTLARFLKANDQTLTLGVRR